MAITLLYQGGLALYYRRRTAAVELALKTPPAFVAGLPPVPPSTPAAGDYSI
jgi:hypothetical protein